MMGLSLSLLRTNPAQLPQSLLIRKMLQSPLPLLHYSRTHRCDSCQLQAVVTSGSQVWLGQHWPNIPPVMRIHLPALPVTSTCHLPERPRRRVGLLLGWSPPCPFCSCGKNSSYPLLPAAPTAAGLGKGCWNPLQHSSCLFLCVLAAGWEQRYRCCSMPE